MKISPTKFLLSHESDWETVDDNNTSGSGGNSTTSSRALNSGW